MSWTRTTILLAALAASGLLLGATGAGGDQRPEVILELLGRADADEDGLVAADAQAAPPQRMRVLDARDREVCAGITDADGALQCRVTPGRHTVTAWPPEGSFLTAGSPPPGQPVTRTVKVTGPPGDTHQEVFASSCMRDLDVEVGPAFSDYDGMTLAYRLSGGPSGEQTGHVALEDTGSAWVAHLAGVAVPGDTVSVQYELTVEAGDVPQVAAPFEVAIERDGACDIHVLLGFPHVVLPGVVVHDADGDREVGPSDPPAAGVQVELIRLTGGVEESVGLSTSDQFGEFTFGFLEPGRYRAHVVPSPEWVPDGEGGVTDVEITLNEGVAGQLTLLATPAVR